LVKASREQEVGDCVCAETLKAEIEIARFAWARLSLRQANGGKSLTGCVLLLERVTESIHLCKVN
jgi:hypothetical protein